MMVKAAMVLLPLVLCVAGGSPEVPQNGGLNWSLALQKIIKSANSSDGDVSVMIPFSAPVQAMTDERFHLVISPAADCYCYVVVESSGNGSVSALYSGPLKANTIWNSPELRVQPPSGSESLYVVTSREEQGTLAQGISLLNDNSTVSQKQAVINEIFRLRSEVSQFREVPEKPVLMGGTSRGDPERSQGVEFSGLNTYVKTISINH